MALQQSFQYSGMTAPNGYIKIESVTLNASSLTALVVWRANAASAPLKDKQYALAYDLAGANPLVQAYTGLKALEEFAGAVDI